ncbi:putative vacuolar protein-sorting-associated protein [Thamnocephalis sphaerospora]|uniref:ESCRT-II complex subunit VPS25 n=1 Tax=Thamnocephalis sphaerospora TaxID=78915 RepID=A0A4P9XVI6_9FUNG|nr:putative vacuolar protein-sorting-associated protein [Thamnocephalis sphaerospora]|eukprot:RKP10287.1 putative vacuolar protein-sorting-associated protein [Thamnocephalis sphaerospora]
MSAADPSAWTQTSGNSCDGVPFALPAIHSFPPFYTRQPTEATRTRQLELWSDLMLAYHQSRQCTRVLLDDLLTSELCQNKSIHRSLSREFLLEILEALVAKGAGDAEWIDGTHRECLIYWRRPDSWAQLIYHWVTETGQRGSVLTLHEITHGDMAASQEFYRLDDSVLRKALAVLVGKGHAQVFSTGDGDSGVKFF